MADGGGEASGGKHTAPNAEHADTATRGVRLGILARLMKVQQAPPSCVGNDSRESCASAGWRHIDDELYSDEVLAESVCAMDPVK